MDNINKNIPKISIAIPCYEMNNLGEHFLTQCLNSIKIQNFKDYEVIISDHSINDNLEILCTNWKHNINLKYFKNIEKRGSSSNNINNAIRNCNGELIKILCQDDYLYDENSLAKIVMAFNKDWLISTYIHREMYGTTLINIQVPYISDDMLFINKIGTHSCLTIKNNNGLFFDENLIWYMDSEYYKQLYLKYGNPVILNDITMIQTLWQGQVTNTLATYKVRDDEMSYLKHKYMEKNGN